MEYGKAEIGRIEDALIPVAFVEGETVQALLSKAHLTLSNDEIVVTLGGRLVNLSDSAQNNCSYVLAKNLKDGCN